MPGDKVQVLGESPGEKESHKRVYYEGSDTLLNGYALCYNRDYTGDGATAADWGRATMVEKPSTANLLDFAGLVTGLPAAGKTGPCRVTIVDARVPQVAVGYSSLTTNTINVTVLAVRPAQYTLGGDGSGLNIGKALQTTAVAGAVLMALEGG